MDMKVQYITFCIDFVEGSSALEELFGNESMIQFGSDVKRSSMRWIYIEIGVEKRKKCNQVHQTFACG